VRDALVEGLGRMRSADAGLALRGLVARAETEADRAKIAEALGGHPGESAALAGLLGDAAAAVRANAVWAVATSNGGDANLLSASIRLLADSDLDVAANAAAAVALVGRRLGGTDRSRARSALCSSLGDWRPYVRANALAGLALLATRCEGGARERDLLAQDRSDAVRRAAARLLFLVAATADDVGAGEDARALSRCAAEDKSGMVAGACSGATPLPEQGEPVVVFVVPDGQTSPVPRAAFSLLRADGLLRSGLADRRGAVFERAAPKGTLSLAVPGALAL
jgi:hypothetical protein